MEPNDPSSKGMKKKLTVAQSNFINKENVFCTKSSMKQVNKLSREPFRSPLSPLMNGTPMHHSPTQSISPPSIGKSDCSLARMKRKHAMLQRGSKEKRIDKENEDSDYALRYRNKRLSKEAQKNPISPLINDSSEALSSIEQANDSKSETRRSSESIINPSLTSMNSFPSTLSHTILCKRKVSSQPITLQRSPLSNITNIEYVPSGMPQVLNTTKKGQKTRVQKRRRFKELPITRLNFDSIFEEGGPSSNSSANGVNEENCNLDAFKVDIYDDAEIKGTLYFGSPDVTCKWCKAKLWIEERAISLNHRP
ncbi:uncharacterized protein [Medicago truncatula]|uniref:uncharacterized protein isoform X2 n=1 Tax=Medicago truncatula TaxID=3880 RepID=UPI0019675771|nr:uncharacterized protein LOC112419100 isoform X2 [Medicago truncatula]